MKVGSKRTFAKAFPSFLLHSVCVGPLDLSLEFMRQQAGGKIRHALSYLPPLSLN